MPRNNYQKFLFGTLDYFTLAANQTRLLDIDLADFSNLQVMVEITYQVTDSPTGVSIDLLYGFGGEDDTAEGGIPHKLDGTSEAIFGDTFNAVTMETFTASSGSPQTKRTVFFLTDPINSLPRWLRLRLKNNDTVNSCTVKIYGDP